MTAKEAMSPFKKATQIFPAIAVDADLPLIDVLPRLLEAPAREIVVNLNGESIGVIDADSMLEGLGRMIAVRDDCSVIVLEMPAEDYSASKLAHAVEDSDAHLVDMFSVPGEGSNIQVTLRVRHTDPRASVRSLERYGYHVVEAHGASESPDGLAMSAERLLSLQTLMNV